MLYRIEQKGLAKSQPQATAKLLLFFFKSMSRHFHASDFVDSVWRDLKAGGVSPELLKKIRERCSHQDTIPSMGTHDRRAPHLHRIVVAQPKGS